MTKPCWIVTFYSYKGGVGRTLAVGNVARFLAEEAGYRVGVVDLDLESPGLPHEPLCRGLDSAAQDGRRKDLLGSIDGKGGFMGLFALSDLELRELNWDGWVESLPMEGNGGLVLMPAGPGSVTKNETFKETLTEFNNRISEKSARPNEDRVDQNAARSLIIFNRFIQLYFLDFLFIDGRTGTNPFFFPVYALRVPHVLVLLMGLNEQNIEGGLSILRESHADYKEKPGPVLLAATPIPNAGSRHLEEKLRNLQQGLQNVAEQRKKEPKQNYIFQIPSQIDFRFPYNDLAAFEEVYFIRSYPHSNLTREYLRLAESLEALTRIRGEGLPVAAPVEVLEKPYQLRIAAENVNFEPFLDFFKRDLGFQFRVGEKPREIQFRSPKGGSITVEFWPAYNHDAPWHSLSQSRKPKLLPDLIVFPQSLLGDLDLDDFFHLEELRSQAGYRNDFWILNLRYLDESFPGWRRWTIIQRHQLGLPYSAVSPLLCTNDLAFQHTSAHLFPTSWELLQKLLDYQKLRFRFAGQKRAFYHEWLNVVLAHGGEDFHCIEGNIPVSSGLINRETIQATERFLQLLARTCFTVKDEALRIADDFWSSRLDCCTGWTGNFRFERDKVGLRLSRQAIVPNEGSQQDLHKCHSCWEKPQDPKLLLRLGRTPRNMDCPRRPLLTPWLLVFPKKSNNKNLRTALGIADLFLRKGTQRKLLRAGFPTASLPLVLEELQLLEDPRYLSRDFSTSGPDRDRYLAHRNYLVHLQTTRDGLASGHATPGFRRASECVQMVCDALLKLHDRRGQPQLNEIESIFTDLYRELWTDFGHSEG